MHHLAPFDTMCYNFEILTQISSFSGNAPVSGADVEFEGGSSGRGQSLVIQLLIQVDGGSFVVDAETVIDVSVDDGVNHFVATVT